MTLLVSRIQTPCQPNILFSSTTPDLLQASMSPAGPLTSANQITLSTFQQTLLLYPASVSQNLHALDSLRYDQIPELLSQRRNDGDAYLEKKDLTELVEWKLYDFYFQLKENDFLWLSSRNMTSAHEQSVLGFLIGMLILYDTHIQQTWQTPPHPLQPNCIQRP